MTVTRRQAREWAIQMLTAADVNPPKPEEVPAFIAAFWDSARTLEPHEGAVPKLRDKLRLFVEERVAGVLGEQKDIDSIIISYLENWDFYRLGSVERAVLRLAVWELKHTDIPHPVVINEAVDLVNWFSEPSARTIVNGILDRYAKSLAQ